MTETQVSPTLPPVLAERVARLRAEREEAERAAQAEHDAALERCADDAIAALILEIGDETLHAFRFRVAPESPKFAQIALCLPQCPIGLLVQAWRGDAEGWAFDYAVIDKDGRKHFSSYDFDGALVYLSAEVERLEASR